MSPGNAVAWNRVTSYRLLLSSFIFPPEFLRGSHPFGAGSPLFGRECLRLALGEPAQCLCVFVHSSDSKQSARLVNHHGAGRIKREGVSCRTTNPGSGISPPTMPSPLEILSSHLSAPATLPTRPSPVVGEPEHLARPRAHRHHGFRCIALTRRFGLFCGRLWRFVGHFLRLASRSNTAAITQGGGTRRSASMS